MSRPIIPLSTSHDDDLLDIRSVASALGVSYTTAYHLATSGEIPFFRIGEKVVRVKASDLRSYISAHRVAKESETLAARLMA